MNVRQVDRAGVEVDEDHGDALPCQGGQLVEVPYTNLASVDDRVWFGAAKAEGEVLHVKLGDSLLQEENKKGALREGTDPFNPSYEQREFLRSELFLFSFVFFVLQ